VERLQQDRRRKQAPAGLAGPQGIAVCSTERAVASMIGNDARPNSEDVALFEPLLSSDQAAELLSIHPKTLQKMARAGTVPCHRIGDLWRFRASELDNWLRRGVHSKPPLVP
jgi:excisionase family DNA binding protein